jgi:hypothetical protein
MQGAATQAMPGRIVEERRRRRRPRAAATRRVDGLLRAASGAIASSAVKDAALGKRPDTTPASIFQQPAKADVRGSTSNFGL